MYNGSVVVAGECMCTRPFSMRREPEFLELIKLLREADTTCCHLEMNIFEHSNDIYPGKAHAASALQADPIIAHELKWAGIDMVSAAYNHNTDWGIPGMLATGENLKKAGIVYAGIGNNLNEAREPGYYESPAGRVGIISISSGHAPNDSAGLAQGAVRGRPGINPIRIEQTYVVDKEDFERLQAIWKKLKLSTRPRYFLHPEEGDVCFNIGDLGGGNAGQFMLREGEGPRIVSAPHKSDVEGNLRAIRDARRQADLVLVGHHASLCDGVRGHKPCEFVVPFAKQCIDEGADAYIGHGWHRQLGIEIYKNRPIFYGTGNFFAQSQFLNRIPADTFEGHAFKIDDLPKLTPADLHDAREVHMGHWTEQPWGIISKFEMAGGKISEIKLYPFTTGYGYDGKGKDPRETASRIEGRPTMAGKEDAEKIINRVKELSEAYNTHIEYKNGIGVITLK